MSSTVCGKCTEFLIYKDDDISCDGFCNHRFHTACANITNHSKELNFIQKNVKWFCDFCCEILTHYKSVYQMELSFKAVKISNG